MREWVFKKWDRFIRQVKIPTEKRGSQSLFLEQSRGCGEEIIETGSTCRQWESIFSIFSMRRHKGLRARERSGIGEIYRLYSSLGAMACAETSSETS